MRLFVRNKNSQVDVYFVAKVICLILCDTWLKHSEIISVF